MLKPLIEALGEWKPSDAGAAHDPVVLLTAGWAEIAGTEVAANSRPARLDDGVLQVTTRSSAWSQQLSYLADHVVAAVRARFPSIRVERLRFRVGALPKPGARPGRAHRRSGASTARREPAAPAATIDEAIARFRSGVEQRRRAKTAAGWNACTGCGALIAPGGASLCVTCKNARDAKREAATARLLFEAPWLGYAATASLVEGLTRRDYDSIRTALLGRWWETLSRACTAKRLSSDNRERTIASSYVVLKTKLPPEEISPATVRNALGDELHDLIYGTEKQAETNGQ